MHEHEHMHACSFDTLRLTASIGWLPDISDCVKLRDVIKVTTQLLYYYVSLLSQIVIICLHPNKSHIYLATSAAKAIKPWTRASTLGFESPDNNQTWPMVQGILCHYPIYTWYTWFKIVISHRYCHAFLCTATPLRDPSNASTSIYPEKPLQDWLIGIDPVRTH